MATEVMQIDSNGIKSLKDVSVNGIVSASSNVLVNGTNVSSKFAKMSHDHYTLTTNSSGIAIKMDDGTLICSGVYYQGDKNMSNAAANACYGGESVTSTNFTFPVAFASTPVVVCNVSSSAYSNSQATAITTTSCHIRHWINYSHGSVTSIEFSYIATGRWK